MKKCTDCLNSCFVEIKTDDTLFSKEFNIVEATVLFCQENKFFVSIEHEWVLNAIATHCGFYKSGTNISG